MQGWVWVDFLWLTVLVLSVVLGLLRGVVQELMSVLGWLVAWVVAQAWSGPVAHQIPWLPQDSSLQKALGFMMTFVVVLLCWRMLSWLLQKIVQATPLAPIDRLLGGVFGLVRGVLIVMVMVALVDYSPLARQPFWQASAGVAWAQRLIGSVQPLLVSAAAPDEFENLPVRS